MIFKALETNDYFRDEGSTYADNGIVIYYPNYNMLGVGEWLEYNGLPLISIHHYADDEEICILTAGFHEHMLNLNEGFSIYVVSKSSREI